VQPVQLGIRIKFHVLIVISELRRYVIKFYSTETRWHGKLCTWRSSWVSKLVSRLFCIRKPKKPFF